MASRQRQPDHRREAGRGRVLDLAEFSGEGFASARSTLMPDVLAALVKLLLYAGATCGAGIALAHVTLRRRVGGLELPVFFVVGPAAALTVFASIMNGVLLLVRLGGDFSNDTVVAVLGTSFGFAAGLQIVGAVLLLSSSLSPSPPRILLVAGAVNFGSALVAFTHVCAAAWWLGALLLLRAACAVSSGQALIALVRAFSRQAMIVVALLLGAGLWLVLTLVDFGGRHWVTPYVLNLSVKIGLAACALAVAAWNKVRLTPRLSSHHVTGAGALRLSIMVELMVIVAVLAATAWMTTFYSPHH
jgi:putative copper export protein